MTPAHRERLSTGHSRLFARARVLIAYLLAAAVLTAGCSAAETTGIIGTSSAAAGPTAAPTTEESTMTDIRLTIAGQAVTARLSDNPTARDLAVQVPMSLTFRDLNSVEKIAMLPRPLTTDGVPEGDDPQIGDIGYYAPVLYYGDVGYWNGIVRIGQFDSGRIGFVQDQPDGFEVTIERG